LLQRPVQYSANDFADASIVAFSPDPAQISSNGRKHPDEKLWDEGFFDKYSEGILAQYIENLDLEDDQEERSSQDGYEAVPNYSTDTDSGEGTMTDDAIITPKQVARLVDMEEHAEASAFTLHEDYFTPSKDN
jgi:hypothetical protein